MLPNKMQIDNAERFSRQLRRLDEALRQAGETERIYIYKETGPPNCSPTSSAIN